MQNVYFVIKMILKVMLNFGLTPFLKTYPDFLAGGAVMVTALFIAAGMEVIQILLGSNFKYKFILFSYSDH